MVQVVDSFRINLNIDKLRNRASDWFLGTGFIVFVLLLGLVLPSIASSPGVVTPVHAQGPDEVVVTNTPTTPPRRNTGTNSNTYVYAHFNTCGNANTDTHTNTYTNTYARAESYADTFYTHTATYTYVFTHAYAITWWRLWHPLVGMAPNRPGYLCGARYCVAPLAHVAAFRLAQPMPQPRTP
jgi:hypothetical protein